MTVCTVCVGWAMRAGIGRIIIEMAWNTAGTKAFVKSIRMTLITVNSSMSATQWKFCKRVFELTYFPKMLSVTGFAIWQYSTMDIIFLMTDQTLLRESWELFFLLVAFGTLKHIVNSGQWEVLVKFFCAFPVFFGMTLLAVATITIFVGIFMTIYTGCTDGFKFYNGPVFV